MVKDKPVVRSVIQGHFRATTSRLTFLFVGALLSFVSLIRAVIAVCMSFESLVQR